MYFQLKFQIVQESEERLSVEDVRSIIEIVNEHLPVRDPSWQETPSPEIVEDSGSQHTTDT